MTSQGQTTYRDVDGSVPATFLAPTVRIIYQSTADKNAHSLEYANNFNKALDYYHRKDYENALNFFTAADRAEPGQVQCVCMLGVCYEQMDKKNLAMGIYCYALQIDNHYALAWHNKAALHSAEEQYTEAKECYLNALRDRLLTGIPEFHTIALNLSNVLMKLNEKEATVRLLEEVLVRGKADNMVVAWLADIHLSLNNNERAYELLMGLPNNGRLRDGIMLLGKSKMADTLVNLAQPNAFRLPKADRLRNAYETAVEDTVKRLVSDLPGADLKVIDCDSIAWLAMKALQSGAKRAVCLVKPWTALADCIVETGERNGYTRPALEVKLYPAEVAEALGDEAKDADLIINAIYTPASVPIVMNRIKAYKDRGIATIPRSGTVRMMGICSDQIRTQCTVQNQVNGFDLTAFGDFCLAIRKYVMHMHLSTIPHQVLTEVASFDLGNEVDTEAFFGKTVDLKVLTAGRIDAVVSWYDLDLADGVVMSMGPDDDCAWQQNVQIVHLDGDGLVEAGDSLHLKLTVTRWTSERSHQWIMFEELLHKRSDEVKQKHETFLLAEDPLGGRLWHFDMMADTARNDAYQRALEAAVTPESIVLDIGTGSGLLALMAARAGAKHVYAIEGNESIAEKARNVIKSNGYADKITVITGMSNDVTIGEGSQMPEQADLVVTETMGADLLSELMYNILNDARQRLLKPGGVIIPRAGRVVGQLVQVDSPWHLSGFPPTEGLTKGSAPDLSAYNKLISPMRICLQLRKVKYTPVSAPFALFSFNFYQPMSKSGNEAAADVTITSAGTLHAIAYWWDCDLGDDKDGAKIVIETGPDSRYAYTDHAHWSQQLQLLDLVGRPVQPGDTISLRMYNDNHLTFVEFKE